MKLSVRTKKINRKRSMGFKRNLSLILIALPGIIALFIWAYLPMYGSIIAFKDYQYVKGIFGSE